MTQKVGYVAVVVRDYDEALTYFINVLGFELIEDTFLEGEKRWVLVAPPGSQGTCLLLALAVTDEQASRVGNQIPEAASFFSCTQTTFGATTTP